MLGHQRPKPEAGGNLWGRGSDMGKFAIHCLALEMSVGSGSLEGKDPVSKAAGKRER